MYIIMLIIDNKNDYDNNNIKYFVLGVNMRK